MSVTARASRWAHTVAGRSRRLPAARRLRFALAEEAIGRFAAGRALDVLDAGGGDGELALALAARFAALNLIVADLDPERLEAGRARTGTRPNVRFALADLTGDLGEERYDVVLAIECLEEIPDDAAAMRSMARALRPGGLLVVHVPERDWQPLLPGSESTWRHEARHGYTAGELAKMLRDAGLEPIVVRPVSHALVRLAQEVRDRSRGRGLKIHLALAPAAVATAWLERHGLRIGRGRALYAEAQRPGV